MKKETTRAAAAAAAVTLNAAVLTALCLCISAVAALFAGDLDILQLVNAAQEASPEATFTLELMDAEPSLRWLAEKGMI